MGANDFEGSDGGPLPHERCPHCGGDGGNNAFINRGIDISTHSFEWVRCFTCDGSGKINAERADFIARGKVLRDARVLRQESLLEASRMMGINPAELSAIELGRAPAEAYKFLSN